MARAGHKDQMEHARFGLSMRWWLALVVAAITAVTAVAVAEVLVWRAETAFRERAERSVLWYVLASADAVTIALDDGESEPALEEVARRRQLSLFLFDGTGAPVGAMRSNGRELMTAPEATRAVRSALLGRRFVRTFQGGRLAVVAVPLDSPSAKALLAFGRQPGYAETMAVFKDQMRVAVLVATGLGGAIGFILATLIARRIRRIAGAARSIEHGELNAPRLRSGFHDEIGELADAIERMRARLRSSIEGINSERARLERLLGRLDQGVVALSPDLRVDIANTAAARLLGVNSLAEGDELADVWLPYFPLQHFAAQLFEPDARVITERVLLAGQIFTICGIPAGRLGTAVLVITDVSALERREEAQREFVANAAHELRTPVAAITSAIEVLQGGAKELPEERDRFLAIVDRQAARLRRLSHALLTLARAEANEVEGSSEPVELCALLEQIASELPENGHLAVTVDCPAELLVGADRDLVEQVVFNLAANAAKHGGGSTVRLSARRAGDAVAIEVTDTGPGIPLAARARILDRFSRGESPDPHGGFGLGLAIVNQAVRVLGGTLTIESEEGSGTTVRVLLPLGSSEPVLV